VGRNNVDAPVIDFDFAENGALFAGKYGFPFGESGEINPIFRRFGNWFQSNYLTDLNRPVDG